MRIVAGWLREARQVPTRQFNARPPGTLISLIVIHCIALPPGCYGGDAVDRLFTGTLEAQAHPYFRALAGAGLSVLRQGALPDRDIRRALIETMRIVGVTGGTGTGKSLENLTLLKRVVMTSKKLRQ